MKFGVQLRLRNWDGLRAMASAADRLHWHSVWFPDHLLPPAYPGSEITDDCMDGWMLLAGLAALTERVQLGCLVSANLFRNPALLAKMAATADAMAHGRCILGIGAGWYEREHTACGFPFPSMKERQDRLEEATALVRQLLRATEPVTFEGQYYRIQDLPFHPSGSRIPIMVGGSGEKRTLRTVARYGDMMNVHGTIPDVVRKLQALRGHCADCGRDPEAIRCSLATQIVLTDDPEEATAARRRLGDDLDEAEQLRSLLVGPATHLREVVRAYEAVGVQEIIIQGLPFDTTLLERIDREVIQECDPQTK